MIARRYYLAAGPSAGRRSKRWYFTDLSGVLLEKAVRCHGQPRRGWIVMSVVIFIILFGWVYSRTAPGRLTCDFPLGFRVRRSSPQCELAVLRSLTLTGKQPCSNTAIEDKGIFMRERFMWCSHSSTAAPAVLQPATTVGFNARRVLS